MYIVHEFNQSIVIVKLTFDLATNIEYICLEMFQDILTTFFRISTNGDLHAYHIELVWLCVVFYATSYW